MSPSNYQYTSPNSQYTFTSVYSLCQCYNDFFEKKLINKEVLLLSREEMAFWNCRVVRKKEEIWLRHMPPPPLHQRKLRKAKWQHKNPFKNLYNTTIVDRLRTVSWSGDSHPTGAVKTDLRDLYLPTNRKSSVIQRTYVSCDTNRRLHKWIYAYYEVNTWTNVFGPIFRNKYTMK